MSSGEPLLEITGLAAGYGRIRVLTGISLSLAEGEFLAIVGANGAGKTTIIKAIMGLIPATGTMSFRGKDLLRKPSYRRAREGIGYIPEGRHVFPGLSVEENLRLTASRGRAKADASKAIEEVYSLFPRLGKRTRQSAGSLSGGEQQMLAFGRAMVLDPQVLIADEISLGLAPIIVDQLYEALGEMHHRGMTILLAEQNARQALEAADSACVFEAGRILLRGSAESLRSDPRVVEAYLELDSPAGDLVV